MPRKGRPKKDPVVQKLTFEEGSDAAAGGEASSVPNPDGEGSKADAGSSGRRTPGSDALPTASERPGGAEQVPTDFAHRDRFRFARPRPEWGTGENDNDGVDASNRFLATCVCLAALILLVQWVKTEGYHLFLSWYMDLWTEDGTILLPFVLGLSSVGFLSSLLVSFVLGLCCVFLSWGITYQDSLQPGEFPPSPVSPKKLRKISGHTFHSSYAMALMNGLAVFTLSAWWLNTYW